MMHQSFWFKSWDQCKRLNVNCYDRMLKIVVELCSMRTQVQMFVAMKDHDSPKLVVVPNWTTSR